VKVLEVDTVRKRIALSIKQTEEAPARNQRPKLQGQQQNNKPQKNIAELPMNDALAALKQKFGR
jgi:uncharacterized protein